MSKDNWDDLDDNNKDINDDDWGDEGDDTPSASSLLSNPSSDEGAGADDWGDTGDASDASLAAGSDTDDDWEEAGDITSGFDEGGHDLESDGEGDEGDEFSDAGMGGAEDAPPEKKKSKLKAYALIGGMGVFVVGILGGGYMVMQSKKAPPVRQMPPQAQVRPDPAMQPERMPAERQAKAAEPVKAEPKTIAPPTGLDLEMEPRIQERPIDRDISGGGRPGSQLDSGSGSSSSDLSESSKADMLAVAVTQLKEDADSHAEKFDRFADQQSAGFEDHEKRIAELEKQIREMAAFIQVMKDKEERAEAEAQKRTADKGRAAPRQAPAKAEDKPVAKAESKPAARPAATPVAKPAAKPAAVSPIQGFSVVATYPSTTSNGVQPQKAWVTNGEKLVQIVVGSDVNGARVTKIEGTTVHTNRGVIRSPR